MSVRNCSCPCHQNPEHVRCGCHCGHAGVRHEDLPFMGDSTEDLNFAEQVNKLRHESPPPPRPQTTKDVKLAYQVRGKPINPDQDH